MYVEAFMEIAIASFFTVKFGLMYTPLGELISALIACFSILVIIFLLPINFYMITRSSKVVMQENEWFKNINGALYDGIRLDNTSQRLYYLHYLVRRVLYLFFAFGVADSVPAIFQIYSLIFLSQASLLYFGHC